MSRFSVAIRPQRRNLPVTPGVAVLAILALCTLILGGLSVLKLMPQIPWASAWPARLALAHLTGSALMAWTVTVAALARGRLTVLPAYLVFGILAVLSLAARPKPKQQPMEAGPGRRIWISFLTLAVALGILSTGWGLITDPNMSIDAYVIWARKAKAFYFAGSFDPLLKGCCGKPNYPVLFPLQSRWVYRHIGHVDDWWHQAMGFIFYLDCVAIAFAGCRAFMPATWAWMGTAIVANNLLNVFLVTRGGADSALSAYFLASSLFLIGYISRREIRSKPMVAPERRNLFHRFARHERWSSVPTRHARVRRPRFLPMICAHAKEGTGQCVRHNFPTAFQPVIVFKQLRRARPAAQRRVPHRRPSRSSLPRLVLRTPTS